MSDRGSHPSHPPQIASAVVYLRRRKTRAKARVSVAEDNLSASVVICSAEGRSPSRPRRRRSTVVPVYPSLQPPASPALGVQTLSSPGGERLWGMREIHSPEHGRLWDEIVSARDDARTPKRWAGGGGGARHLPSGDEPELVPLNASLEMPSALSPARISLSIERGRRGSKASSEGGSLPIPAEEEAGAGVWSPVGFGARRGRGRPPAPRAPPRAAQTRHAILTVAVPLKTPREAPPPWVPGAPSAGAAGGAAGGPTAGGAAGHDGAGSARRLRHLLDAAGGGAAGGEPGSSWARSAYLEPATDSARIVTPASSGTPGSGRVVKGKKGKPGAYLC